nr:MAG TPA: hypothetical protein [Caudoviricetes sp.]
MEWSRLCRNTGHASDFQNRIQKPYAFPLRHSGFSAVRQVVGADDLDTVDRTDNSLNAIISVDVHDISLLNRAECLLHDLVVPEDVCIRRRSTYGSNGIFDLAQRGQICGINIDDSVNGTSRIEQLPTETPAVLNAVAGYSGLTAQMVKSATIERFRIEQTSLIELRRVINADVVFLIETDNQDGIGIRRCAAFGDQFVLERRLTPVVTPDRQLRIHASLFVKGIFTAGEIICGPPELRSLILADFHLSAEQIDVGLPELRFRFHGRKRSAQVREACALDGIKNLFNVPEPVCRRNPFQHLEDRSFFGEEVHQFRALLCLVECDFMKCLCHCHNLPLEHVLVCVFRAFSRIGGGRPASAGKRILGKQLSDFIERPDENRIVRHAVSGYGTGQFPAHTPIQRRECFQRGAAIFIEPRTPRFAQRIRPIFDELVPDFLVRAELPVEQSLSLPRRDALFDAEVTETSLDALVDFPLEAFRIFELDVFGFFSGLVAKAALKRLHCVIGAFDVFQLVRPSFRQAGSPIGRFGRLHSFLRTSRSTGRSFRIRAAIAGRHIDHARRFLNLFLSANDRIIHL